MNIPSPSLCIKRLSLFAIIALGTLGFCPAFAQESPELDAFLATPVPAAPITEEIARKTVEKGNALAATAAARRDEVTAYLIPFQRVLGVPADQQPAPAPTSAIVPRPKPFLIFKSSEGVAEFFKATTVSTQGEFMVAQSAEGKKGMWQKSHFATQLPWYYNEEMESGSLDLETLALRYKVLETTFPALKNVLQGEMERIQKIGRKFTDVADQKKLKLTETATRIIAQRQSYSQEHNYTLEELTRMLLEAEDARRKLPEQALKIDKAMEPFRTHFENLLAKRVFVDGIWQDRAVVEQSKTLQTAAEEAQAFEKDLRLEINAQIVSKSSIQVIGTSLAILAVVVFLCGLYLLIGKTAIAARAAGVLLCLTPATLWIYGSSQLSAPYPSAPSFVAASPKGTNNVVRVLFLASKAGAAPVSELDRRITLRESDLNSFVRQYVKFAGAPESGLCRTDLAFQLLPEEVIVWELSRYQGRPFRLRYDLKTEGVGAQMKISDVNVAIGSFTLPGLLGKQMLNNLTAELAKIYKGSAVFQSYKITRLTEGETDLTSIPHVEAPAATPAAVATEAPAAPAAPAAPVTETAPSAPAPAPPVVVVQEPTPAPAPAATAAPVAPETVPAASPAPESAPAATPVAATAASSGITIIPEPAPAATPAEAQPPNQ